MAAYRKVRAGFVLICIICLLFCTSNAETETTAALLGCGLDTARGTHIVSDIENKLQSVGIAVEIYDCENKLERQRENCLEAIGKKPDYLVVMPYRAIGMETQIETASAAGIKIIFVETFMPYVSENDYLCRICPDTEKIADQCAQVFAELAGGTEMRILELTGREGSTWTNGLAKSFRMALCRYPNLSLIDIINDEKDGVEVRNSLLEYANQNNIREVDAVLAYSDQTALDTVYASVNLGGEMQHIKAIAVGGQEDVKKAVKNGILSACNVCSADYGSYVVNVIRKDQNGETVDKVIRTSEEMLFADSADNVKGY